jgi:Arc/MetJ-type ribon-helix-helix transcriptional regulator
MVGYVTMQITVRLPDDMVEFVDQQVAEGQAPSRASVVERALGREIRRQLAARDAAILARAAAGPDGLDPDDLDGLAGYAAGLPMEIEPMGIE